MTKTGGPQETDSPCPEDTTVGDCCQTTLDSSVKIISAKEAGEETAKKEDFVLRIKNVTEL